MATRTPEIRRVARESLGYDEYSMWIDTGMTFERKRESLRRLVEDVMQAFS